jgi:hypothetical protein
MELGISTDGVAVFKTLNQNQVEYLLIGGYAMRFYGATRVTRDLDLLVHNSAENARRLFESIQLLLNDLPYSPGFTANDLTKPCKKFMLQRHEYKLDILTSVNDLDFATAYREQEVAFQRGITIPVAAKEHLLFIKRTAVASDESRREKELPDIAFLESLET